MNGEIYLKKCLKGILLPWLESNFDRELVLFWPDMATCHYTASCVAFLEEHGIQFIRKDENAPNLPQARPIETFWSLCKREYSKLANKPQDLKSFSRRWIIISQKQVQNSGANLFKNLRKKLALVRKFGPYGPLRARNQ